MFDVRLMADEDVAEAAESWHAANAAVRERLHLPVESRTPEAAEAMENRLRHLRATDPGGSWVAAHRARVVGVAQALVRDDLWVLSLLGVSPEFQDQGVGKALLEAALTYGTSSRRGLILCSRDPRAARRYVRAGFDVHPSVAAWGRVDPSRLPPSGRVRPGTSADAGLVTGLDRRVRGGAHGPDLEYLLHEGCRLLVIEEEGYVVARGPKPVFLAAVDEAAAVELVAAAMATAGTDEIVEINWVTAAQQWALRLAVEAGLELYPAGPVMTRGFDPLPATYLPSGAFG